MKVENKKIIVTGAGSGIGRELTLAIAEKGGTAIAVDINEEALKETKKLANDNEKQIFTYILNIADKSAVEKFADKIIETHKKIDGLINNAGIIQPFVKLDKLDYKAIDMVMNVNFFGMLYMTKAFLPILQEQSEANITNVSSMGGFLPVPGQSLYGASKAAVKLLTEGLYAELLDTNVHISVVFPGATNTNIAKNSGIKNLGTSKNSNIKMTSAKEAAQIIVDGIEKNKPQIFTGSDCKMMNMLYRINPIFAIKTIAKQMKSLLK